jgi:S-adenosylmethionine hydrolase
MTRPVVALLSDFGLRDHYVGAMKGVVLSGCPEATLVDITHDVPAHDVAAGALTLAAAFRYFPSGSVFLAVVDPGVGSARRRLAAEGGGYRFVGPDNGLLSLALDEIGAYTVVELADRGYVRRPSSPTFDGRDWFAPAAARLAAGGGLADLGPELETIERIAIARPRLEVGVLEGQVVSVDRFGNLITNLDRPSIDRLALPAPRIVVRDLVVDGIVSTYADVVPGAFCALVGSSGRLEIARRGGSAAAALGAGPGTTVRVLGRA